MEERFDTAGGEPVVTKDEFVALALLIRYSEEEAQRLGAPSVVVECLRMASVELRNTIDVGRDSELAKVVRMN